MLVNGSEVFIEPETALTDFLEANNYNLAHIAIELNGSILPKSEYASTRVSDADTLEIVNFVGGG